MSFCIRENKLSRQREFFRPISEINVDLAERGEPRAANYSTAFIASHVQAKAVDTIRLAARSCCDSPYSCSIPSGSAVGSSDSFLIRCSLIRFDIVLFVIRERVIRLR